LINFEKEHFEKFPLDIGKLTYFDDNLIQKEIKFCTGVSLAIGGEAGSKADKYKIFRSKK
jgi:hypothetical protein